MWRLTRHENARKCALDALSEGGDADDPGALWNNKYAPSYTNGGPELTGCCRCRSDCHSGATVRCIVASESANSVTTVADDGRCERPSHCSMPLLGTVTRLLLQFGGMAEQLTRTMKWFICHGSRLVVSI